MDRELRKQINKSIRKQLIESKQFHSPILEFTIRNENEYIVLALERDQSKECVVILSKPMQMIPIDEVTVNGVPNFQFEGCIEAYFFSKLNFGYEIVDVHEEIHEFLWSFIEEFYPVANLFEKGVKKYLQFCNCSGITFNYLNFYKGIHTNLYEKYHIFCPLEQWFEQLQINHLPKTFHNL